MACGLQARQRVGASPTHTSHTACTYRASVMEGEVPFWPSFDCQKWRRTYSEWALIRDCRSAAYLGSDLLLLGWWAGSNR